MSAKTRYFDNKEIPPDKVRYCLMPNHTNNSARSVITPKVKSYNGDKRWFNINGQLHRDNDLPAIEKANGDKFWYVNGKRHRGNDLPAVEKVNGDKEWLVNGKHHRVNDLPAVEYASGNKEWCVNGKLHRDNDLPAIENIFCKEWCVNGKQHRLGGLPAVECANGSKRWYIYDKNYTYNQVCNYYKILARFGRYCLKKIRINRLKRVKMIHRELLCMPPKGSYPGGQDYHQMVSYFMSI
jgi:hypothetical protein